MLKARFVLDAEASASRQARRLQAFIGAQMSKRRVLLPEVGSCCREKRMLRALTVTIFRASAAGHEVPVSAIRACADSGQPSKACGDQRGYIIHP